MKKKKHQNMKIRIIIKPEKDEMDKIKCQSCGKYCEPELYDIELEECIICEIKNRDNADLDNLGD